MPKKTYIELEPLIQITSARMDNLRQHNSFFDHYSDGYNECIDRIMEQPTADVVEVVRCKDCAYSEKITDPLHGDKIRVCNFRLYKQAAPDMHYCSHGLKDGRKG